MQTFLPYADFDLSVKALDWRRLGKQRVEAYQILKTIRHGGRWSNHPACLMWTGYEEALTDYMNCCILEWIRRGYKNNMLLCLVDRNYRLPPWFGHERFHSSHRSNLLRKDEVFYREKGWEENSSDPYLWPLVVESSIQFRIISKKKPPVVSYSICVA